MSRVELRDGALAGLLAAAGAAGLLALLGALRLTSFVPLDIANTIIALAPGQVATETIEAIGVWGKRLLVAGGLSSFVAAGAALGVLLAWLRGRQPAEPRRQAPWLVSGTLLGLLPLPLTLALQYLVPANRATLPPLLYSLPSLLLVYAMSGALLGSMLYGLRLLRQQHEERATLPRRAFLRSAGGALLALAFGGSTLAWLLPEPAPEQAGAKLPPAAATAPPQPPMPPAAGPAAGFVAAPGARPELTTQEQLYVISSSTRDPVLDPQQWRLKIHGAVDQPYELTYDELLAMPRYEQISTLQCISNEIGGPLIGNCSWHGVRLRDLLERAGVAGGVFDVVLRAADGYSDSIPLERALEPETLVVYGIDDQALEVNHGFPARIRVPGLYGVKNVKWLTEIELVRSDYLGYWQQRGWTDDATIFTTAVFDTGNPHLGGGELALRDGMVALGGIAFAGDRGIQKLELQIDGGAWHEAQLKPAVSELSWRLWRYDWPTAPGLYTLAVRAVDGTGALQTAEFREPHPDGASGYHIMRVRVREQ